MNPATGFSLHPAPGDRLHHARAQTRPSCAVQCERNVAGEVFRCGEVGMVLGNARRAEVHRAPTHAFNDVVTQLHLARHCVGLSRGARTARHRVRCERYHASAVSRGARW